MRVALAGDDPVLQRLVQGALQRLGHQLIVAVRGARMIDLSRDE